MVTQVCIGGQVTNMCIVNDSGFKQIPLFQAHAKPGNLAIDLSQPILSRQCDNGMTLLPECSEHAHADYKAEVCKTFVSHILLVPLDKE